MVDPAVQPEPSFSRLFPIHSRCPAQVLPSNNSHVIYLRHLCSIKPCQSFSEVPHPFGPTQQHSSFRALTQTTNHPTMQLSIKTASFALAVFLPLAFAAALEQRTEDIECKPILQSCAVDAECCADLCVAGVSILSLSLCYPRIRSLEQFG